YFEPQWRDGTPHYGVPRPAAGGPPQSEHQCSRHYGLLSHSPQFMTDIPGSLRTTRILLVDDHPVVRDGLAEAINQQPGMAVCAVAEDRHEALRAAESTKPELMVIDLMLKNSSGLELIKDVHARWPRLPIMVVSMQEENRYAERALREGARGYITKQQATLNILVAIRKVLNGEIYLSEKVANSVLARLAANPEATWDSITDTLTDRELQVFE